MSRTFWIRRPSSGPISRPRGGPSTTEDCRIVSRVSRADIEGTPPTFSQFLLRVLRRNRLRCISGNLRPGNYGHSRDGRPHMITKRSSRSALRSPVQKLLVIETFGPAASHQGFCQHALPSNTGSTCETLPSYGASRRPPMIDSNSESYAKFPFFYDHHIRGSSLLYTPWDLGDRRRSLVPTPEAAVGSRPAA